MHLFQMRARYFSALRMLMHLRNGLEVNEGLTYGQVGILYGCFLSSVRLLSSRYFLFFPSMLQLSLLARIYPFMFPHSLLFTRPLRFTTFRFYWLINSISSEMIAQPIQPRLISTLEKSPPTSNPSSSPSSIRPHAFTFRSKTSS